MLKKLHKPSRWHRLDNTANIFPVVASRKKTNVFRVSAVLNEKVNPQFLQTALEQTFKKVPSFSVRLKNGVFWSYLESADCMPTAEKERFFPCRFIDPRQRKGLLFRVLYFENRIHLEVFHALTDGTGAMRFLKALCYRYLQLAHSAELTPEQNDTVYGLEGAANIQDGYMKNYRPAKVKTFKEGKAFTFKGERLADDGINVFTALMSVENIKSRCREYGATITQYLAAQLAYAVYTEAMCGFGAKRPVNIFVPVNLRKILKTETTLNFFSNVLISLPFTRPEITFAETLEYVKKEFEIRLNKEELLKKLAYTAGSQNNIAVRFMPLAIKKLVLKIIYLSSVKSSTMAFSNLALQSVEPAFEKYFNSFRFMLSPSRREPVTATAVSCGDKMAFTVATTLESSLFVQAVMRNIAADGVDICLETNIYED